MNHIEAAEHIRTIVDQVPAGQKLNLLPQLLLVAQECIAEARIMFDLATLTYDPTDDKTGDNDRKSEAVEE